MDVAVHGTGTMGAPMARRLAGAPVMTGGGEGRVGRRGRRRHLAHLDDGPLHAPCASSKGGMMVEPSLEPAFALDMAATVEILRG